MSVAKATRKYTVFSFTRCGQTFFLRTAFSRFVFGLGAFQVLGIIMLEYRLANLFVNNHINDYANNGADDFYDDNVIKEYE